MAHENKEGLLGGAHENQDILILRMLEAVGGDYWGVERPEKLQSEIWPRATPTARRNPIKREGRSFV
jgi:hypothetical protein